MPATETRPVTLGEAAENVEGRCEYFIRPDQVCGVILDGSSRRRVDHVLVGEDRLTCKVQLAGAGRYQFTNAAAQEIGGERLIIAHQPAGAAKREIIPEGVRERSVIICFPRSGQTGLAGCEAETEEVRAAAAFLSGRTLFRQHAMPRAAAECASAILDGRRSPWNQERYKQAKIDELACLLLDFFLNQFRARSDHGLCERDARRVQQARAVLRDRMERPPTVEELAGMVGLNRTKLNAGFRALWGQSVHQVFQRDRMEVARTLLEAGELSIGEIADLCGYGHLSNFSLAYKAHFGVSPSAARELPANFVRPA